MDLSGDDLPGPLSSPSDSLPPWLAAVGTVAAYGVILTAMFLLLFVVPYLLFVALG